MRIVIAGGTGFLGGALRDHLRRLGHTVLILTRRPTAGDPAHAVWTPNGASGAWENHLNGADALVNLAGAGIADARWTEGRKATLRSSRILSTRSLVAAIRNVPSPPAIFVSASGIDYYGPRGDERVTEDDAPGRGFLAELCAKWEDEARQAAGRTRVVLLRSGLVLHPSGGALRRMLLPFRLGLGGRLGSGAQYLPWIHLQDWLDLVTWLITTADMQGPFNLTAPEPASNRDFTRALGRALHRPAIVPVPAFALRLALGELADTLLTGRRAVPARALEHGFEFQYPRIERALQDLLR